MNEFSWKVAQSPQEAASLKQQSGSQLLAGGTTQLDLMKCGVFTPPQLIGISGLTELKNLQFEDDKITAGALVTMSQLTDHPECQQSAPAIYGSLWQAASPQIRNMASLGGNLRQRTRCAYYRDPATFTACNKRNPGSGCAALDGVNSSHAILGASDSCIAVYPGDLAVALVEIDYETSPALIFATDEGVEPKPLPKQDIDMGDAQAAMQQAEVRLSQRYTTPREYNMPMEPHACVAQWQDGRITVWEPSQWVAGAQVEIAEWMGIEVEDVRIISPYVGGGFGSKPVPYTHVALASVASRALNRPIKVSLTRPQTFTGLGGRAATSQQLELGASRDGKIQAIIQRSFSETSLIDVFAENCSKVTARMYAVENVSAQHQIRPINTVTPGWMRAPGENPSAFGLEVAMDEMAYALNIDPLELRLRNWADKDYQLDLPWSSRRLKEAYQKGAEAFGWNQRIMTPRSMREGRELIGWGMASGTYPVNKLPAEAKIILTPQGTFVVQCGGADIGTGTYTILAQTAADILGVASTTIEVQLGDTELPRAGVAGGSQLAGNVTAAVDDTAKRMRDQLLKLASELPQSPLKGTPVSQLTLKGDGVQHKQGSDQAVSFAELASLAPAESLAVKGGTFPDDMSESERDKMVRNLNDGTRPEKFSAHSWSAHFVEVRVDEDFGTIRVKRMVAALDSGRLYNPKLARSQWIGGMIMGVGQALMEEGIVDPRNGRVINNNLADYLVPVNGDIPDITTINVGEPDFEATTMGGKPVGELGIVGVAAAISNAVFHATGKRVRDLPITLDKII